MSAVAPWNVVLLDDDEHTYEYVIEMLSQLFGYDIETAYRMACEVDKMGEVVIYSAEREIAEMECRRVLNYGRDPRMHTSRGSMRAVVVPRVPF